MHKRDIEEQLKGIIVNNLQSTTVAKLTDLDITAVRTHPIPFTQ